MQKFMHKNESDFR